MNRRLLLGYLGVTLFVLVALEVPLGVQNQRSVRHDLESKVTSDAWVLSADAEDAVQTLKAAQLRQWRGSPTTTARGPALAW